MTTFEQLVIVYGSCSRDPGGEERFGDDVDVSEQRRAEITLKPLIPASATSIEKKHQWWTTFRRSIGTDMKHSRNWRCEFCTKSARETVWMNASWMHLPEPRATSYVHHVCDAAIGPCADKLRAVDAEMARMSGLPPTGSLPPVPKPKGTKFPMSSSCAVCNNETSESRKSLKQCAKCQLTRYCSVECQRSDWPRHKACCKVVKEVKWIWN